MRGLAVPPKWLDTICQEIAAFGHVSASICCYNFTRSTIPKTRDQQRHARELLDMKTHILASVFFLSCMAALPVHLHADGLYSYTISESGSRIPGDVRIELDVESFEWPDMVSAYGPDARDEIELGVIMRFAF